MPLAGAQQINVLDSIPCGTNLRSPLTGKDKFILVHLSVSYQPDIETVNKKGARAGRSRPCLDGLVRNGAGHENDVASNCRGTDFDSSQALASAFTREARREIFRAAVFL